MIHVILLWFVVAASCSANELPAKAYIDVDDIGESSDFYLNILAKLIETYGDQKDPKETLKMLWRVKSESYARSEDSHLVSDNFELANELSLKQFGELHSAIAEINNLIGNPGDYYTVRLDIFLGLIKKFLAENLGAFASKQPTNRPILHDFLHYYGREILSRRLKKAISVQISPSTLMALERVIGWDPEMRHSIDLISMAKGLNLAKGNFDTKSMLKRLEKYQIKEEASKPVERLPFLLSTICDNLSWLHRRDMEIYTWSRVLIPGELAKLREHPSDDFLVLAEFWRICLPVMNHKTFAEVKRNVGRIMAIPSSSSLRGRFKNILGG